MENNKNTRLSLSVYTYLTIMVTVLTIASFEHFLDARVSSIIPVMSRQATSRRNKTQKIDARDFVGKSRTNRTLHIVAHVPNHGMLKGDPNKVDFSACVVKNCKASVSKNTSGADAIIIQGSRPSQPLPERINDKQIILFASTESPLYLSYVNLSDPFWNTYYNWSMTYRIDSDIPYMYGYVYPKYVSDEHIFTQLQTDNFLQGRRYLDYEEEVFLNPLGIENKNYKGIFRKKNVTAGWLVSHCSTSSKREVYVQNMTGTIDIDIFGKCSKRDCPKGDNTYCVERLINRTFFYIAFENSYCTDYLTEKAFKWFERDIVIVTRGARNYNIHLPKGTYVDADDFSSPIELAEFLKWLSSNEKEYVQYLKRKDMYKVFQRDKMAQVAFCNLCRKLSNIESYGKTFDMQRSWVHGSCIGGKKIKIVS